MMVLLVLHTLHDEWWWKLAGCRAFGIGIDGPEGEYDAAEWKFFFCQFQLPKLCLGGNLDDLTSFDRLARLASFSFRYLARSSSKLSFSFLPLCLLWSLAPFILRCSDFNISGRPWSKPVWPVWATGLTCLVPVWPVEQTGLTCLISTAGVIGSCSDCEEPVCPLVLSRFLLSSSSFETSSIWTMSSISLEGLESYSSPIFFLLHGLADVGQFCNFLSSRPIDFNWSFSCSWANFNRPELMADCIIWRNILQFWILWLNELCNLQ